MLSKSTKKMLKEFEVVETEGDHQRVYHRPTQTYLGAIWRSESGWSGKTAYGVRIEDVPERRALIRTMKFVQMEASLRRGPRPKRAVTKIARPQLGASA